MKRIIGILLLLALTNVIYAETAPEEAWNKTFGGNSNDIALSVQQTSDGGYILAGETYSYGAGQSDIWLVKTDSEGNRVWDTTFGGTGLDYAHSVQQTSDGGYILAGGTRSYSTGESDFWLVKTDSEGGKEWDRSFGGASWDLARSVQQTSDGGYILAGVARSYGYSVDNSDFWLVKTDSDGNKQWDRIFGGTGSDIARSVQQTSDGGYILAGDTFSYGANDHDFWLVKTNSQGDEEWNGSFGGTGLDIAYSVQQTFDDGYILAGVTNSYGAGSRDVWLVKTDSDGGKEWDRLFGGTSWDLAQSVQQTSDGGYILVGHTESYGAGEYDFWLVKTDSNGNKMWDMTFGGTDWDSGHSVQQTSDDGYILAGGTRSYGVGRPDFWLIKVGGTPISTETIASTSDICIRSAPSEADIYLDGVYKGATGSDWFRIYGVSSGYHTITLEKSGYDDYTETVYVSAGDVKEVYAYLTPTLPTTSISVSSAPSGADIYLDGTYKGTTPATISDASPGSHALKLEKYGYAEWLTSVYVTSGVTESITAHLTAADVSPPAIRIDKPAIIDQNNNELLEEGEKVEITYGANDPSGVASIKILLDGTLLESQNQAGTYTVTTNSLTTGKHVIRVEATDSKSNSGFEELPITVERTGPSVYFGTTRTTINKGEDAIFTLSAVNPIGNPPMTIQLILKPPTGVSVTSSSFAKAGSGIYTCTHAIESGDNVRSIEVRLTGNQAGTHKIESEVYYQFDGSPKSPTRYETLTLIVPQDTRSADSESEAREIVVPGFGLMIAIIGLLAAYLRRIRI